MLYCSGKVKKRSCAFEQSLRSPAPDVRCYSQHHFISGAWIFSRMATVTSAFIGNAEKGDIFKTASGDALMVEITVVQPG